MNITASVIEWSLLQGDGRYNVREQLTDDQGNVSTFDYMAEADTDQQAHLASRVAEAQGQQAAEVQDGSSS